MKGWRTGLANAALVLGSVLLTLLALEGVLRLLPVASGLPVEPPTAANPIQRYVADTPYTWSAEWDLSFVVRGRSNAQGFLADYDYDPKAETPLVAVVGDSFVEALRVPFAQTLTGRLQAALGTRGRAYAFAQSGAPLSQYVAYARHACATYRPEKLVVNVVGNDFDESLHAHRQRDGIHHLYPQPGGGFDWKLTPLPEPGVVERIARNSALALYLARNVKAAHAIHWFRPTAARAATPAPAPYVGNTSSAADPARVAEGEAVIRWFLDALPGAACLPPRDIVLVVDAIRPEMYDAGALEAARASYFGRMRATLMVEARARGFVVVDTEGPFAASFARDGKRFEFPNDMHWNAHGHAVAAAAVADALRPWPPLAGGAASLPVSDEDR